MGAPDVVDEEEDEVERDTRTVAVVVAIVAVSNVVSNRLLPSWAYVGWNLAVAVGLVVVARRLDRLTLADLGLARADVGRGLRWGGVVAGSIVVAYAIGLAIPSTRELFRDQRAAGTGWDTVYRALVSVPLGTVALEEVTFRGVLPAVFSHRVSRRAAIAWASLLFGLWHVLPAAHVNRSNAAVRDVLGGPIGQVVAVAAAVVSTAAVGVFFCWLRDRSRSLWAPALVHVTTNSLGYLIAWLVTSS